MPQRKQRQKQAALLSKLDTGDEVITTGGIIGTITFVEADLYHIEIDTDVVIRIAKSGVAKSLSEPPEPAKGASKSKGGSRARKGLLAGALDGSASSVADPYEQNASDSESLDTVTDSDTDAAIESASEETEGSTEETLR